jgi:Immunoglobulin I-set domain
LSNRNVTVTTRGFNQFSFIFARAVAPQILGCEFKDKTTFDSLPISYEIQARGIPKPEAEWLCNGTPVKASDRIKITNDGEKYRLDIVDVKMCDAGEWKGVIKNCVGEKALSANLEVIRKCSKYMGFLKTVF